MVLLSSSALLHYGISISFACPSVMDFCDTFVLSQGMRYWRETYLSPPPTLPLTPHRDFLLLHAFNYQIHHLFPELWSLISASCFLSAPKNAESWSFFHLYWFTFLINFIRDDVFFFFFTLSATLFLILGTQSIFGFENGFDRQQTVFQQSFPLKFWCHRKEDSVNES